MTPYLFCVLLPKIELHAHLNGSLNEKTLKSLGCLDQSILEYRKLTNIINKTEKTLDECFELFKVAHRATKDQHSVYLAAKSVIEDFFEDNIIYLELRTTPRAGDNMTKEEYIDSVVKAIKDNEKDIIVKLILSIDRSASATSQDSLNVILKMKEKYPEIIKGIDLSGNPYVGSFDKELFKIARENNLRTTLHCAEIKNDDEVEDILNFVPDRLGHATYLHPRYGGSEKNWELYCKLKIPAEFCLSSNVVCGTSKSYEEHHIQEWIRNSLPFSINTDDKGVFCTSLSREYDHIMKNFNITTTNLWDLSYGAIDHSFASTDEKMLLKKKMEEWKEANLHYF